MIVIHTVLLTAYDNLCEKAAFVSNRLHDPYEIKIEIEIKSEETILETAYFNKL